MEGAHPCDMIHRQGGALAAKITHGRATTPSQIRRARVVHPERPQPCRSGTHPRGYERVGVTRTTGSRAQERGVEVNAGQPAQLRRRALPGGSSRRHAVGSQPARRR
jgi:hypothetical protein